MTFVQRYTIILAIVLILLTAAGIAVVRWFNYAAPQPMQPESLTNPTSTTSTLPSGLNNLTSTASATATTVGNLAWETFTDADGLFSMQYPTSYGPLWVTTSTDGSTEPATDLTIENTATGPDSDNSLDVTIMPNDPTLESYERTHVSLIPQASISIPGMTGMIYKESDNGAIIAFLANSMPGDTSTFYLNFNHAEMGVTPHDVPLPAYWRQMLNSFRAITSN
jgi:hypothetical protein